MTARLPAAEIRRIAEIALAEQLADVGEREPSREYIETTRGVMRNHGVKFWFAVFDKAGLLTAPSAKRRRPAMRKVDTS